MIKRPAKAGPGRGTTDTPREASMDICVLASGSSGNATYVRSGDTAVLIDAGISFKRLRSRLALAGLRPESIDAVLVSHGHSDHVNGIPVLCGRLGVPVYANLGTARQAGIATSPGEGSSRRFATGTAFHIGDMRILPFPVPHDACDPVGFVVSDGSVKACFATDLGSATPDVLDALSGSDAIVLEFNHDEAMLEEGPYPAFLKKRVAGPMGHLSNEAAAGLLQAVAHEGLRHVVLAHLSRTNNLPGLCVEAASRSLGKRRGATMLSLGWQDRAGEVLTLG